MYKVKSIVNSISLKEGEEIFINQARTILKYGKNSCYYGLLMKKVSLYIFKIK